MEGPSSGSGLPRPAPARQARSGESVSGMLEAPQPSQLKPSSVGADTARPSSNQIHHAPVNELMVDRLRRNICRVPLTRPFDELEVARPDSFLDPELTHGQVPHAPDTGPATHADGRAALCAHPELDFHAQVPGDRREP
eukprot:8027247-Alexandrium_andersonii.AAC.1